MSKKTNRTFKQIIHDIFEEGALAFAMSYAVTRGDMNSVRMFEEKPNCICRNVSKSHG